jgi:hypothetical protein
LIAYIKIHLPDRQNIYFENTNLAIFDLGILLNMCPNTNCESRIVTEGFTRHVREMCLEFYQIEGEKVYQWDEWLNADEIIRKIWDRKKWLKNTINDPTIAMQL